MRNEALLRQGPAAPGLRRSRIGGCCKYTDIALTDLDNDGKMDYILGTGRGGLMVMTELDTLTASNLVDFPSFEAAIVPNPIDNKLRIKVNQSFDHLRLKISNALGQVLLSKGLYATDTWIELPAMNLAKGVYYIELITEKERKTLSFVKK